MPRRMRRVPINENITLLDDAGASTCYLVTGEKRALLIDTANGREDLREIVGELTGLPLTVVNTHGHGDHILGNAFFEEAYLHPADWEMHNQLFSSVHIAQELAARGLKPCRLLPLAEDAVFDLGGITLEAIPVPGHTKGCVALLCRRHRILFTGDAVINHLWMQLDHSEPLSVLISSLESLLSKYGNDFDHLLTGHGTGLQDAVLARELLRGARELLLGECGGDIPNPWFQGVDMAHPVNEDGSHRIVYNAESLRIQRGLRPPYPPVTHMASNPSLSGMAYLHDGIVYSSQTGKDLTLALYTPWREESAPTPPAPLIVFVQGSAWTFPDIHYQMGQMARYAQNGIAVALVTHRNCLDGHPFPAFLQDVKTAVRFLRAHTEEYHIDKTRVGVFGTSSGGNTALLMGLTGDDPAYKTQEYASESDAVRLVVECFGPTDLPSMLGRSVPEGPHGDIFRALVGDADVRHVFEAMSPYRLVKAGQSYPPFLLIHGSADPLVPYDQMTMMYRRLIDCGAQARAVCVDGAPHECSFWSWELHELILAFLREKL